MLTDSSSDSHGAELHSEGGAPFTQFRHSDTIDCPQIARDTAYGFWTLNRLLDQVSGRKKFNREKELKRALADNDHFTYILGSSKPLERFLEFKSQINDRQYWRLIRSLWLYPDKDLDVDPRLRSCLRSKRSSRIDIMTRREVSALKKFSFPLRLFRGVRNIITDDGWSWSLSEEMARKFALKYYCTSDFDREGVILRGLCAREDLLAYFETCNEYEIVIPWDRVTDKESKVVTGCYAQEQWPENDADIPWCCFERTTAYR
jgi:hypothetical protein